MLTLHHGSFVGLESLNIVLDFARTGNHLVDLTMEKDFPCLIQSYGSSEGQLTLVLVISGKLRTLNEKIGGRRVGWRGEGGGGGGGGVGFGCDDQWLLCSIISRTDNFVTGNFFLSTVLIIDSLNPPPPPPTHLTYASFSWCNE